MSQQKTPMSGMSSSLKERLKKCGRFHPATPPYGRPCTSPPASQEQDWSSGGVHSTPLSSLHLPVTTDHATANNSLVPSLSSQLATSARDVSTQNTAHNNMRLSQSATTAATVSTPNTASKKRLLQPRNILRENFNVFEQSSVDENSGRRCALFFPETCDSSVTKQDEAVNINLGESRAGFDAGCESSISEALTSQPVAGVATSRTNFANGQGQGGLRSSTEELLKAKKELESQLVQRKEVLRKLTMVKTYRTKNDLHQLQTLIDKWRSTCQQAVLDLHQRTSEPRPSLTQLMHQMGLDADLLNYNEEEEGFDVG